MEIPDLGFRATIGAALRHRAVADADVDFVVSADRRMTFAEAEVASAHVARQMLAQGIGKGTRVGLYFSYSHEWVICWLAASRIGALVMPFSTIYAPGELGKVVAAGDAQVLITSSSVLGKDTPDVLTQALPGLAGATDPELRLLEAPYLRGIWFTDLPAVPWGRALDLSGSVSPDVSTELFGAVEARVTPGDLAVVVYTSGSSAEPKGVIHTHGSVLRDSVILPPMMREHAQGLHPKIICGMPFFWVGGILSLAGALLGPITLVIMPKFDAGEALRLVERERATSVMGWPTLIQRMRSHPDFETRDLSSAPTLTSGPADLATLDTPIPGVPGHRGMSETMGTFAGIEVKIIDPFTGEQVRDGEDGELLVRGHGVMAGYYNKERHEVFDADGWYHTGDRVFRVADDPRVFFQGRYTEMIKSSGANIAPREVELTIEQLPEVAHCFVMGFPDMQREEEVTALVVPSADHEYVQEDVTANLRRELSAYKIPTRWILLEPEDVPWLGSGKPDKVTLRRRVEAGELK